MSEQLPDVYVAVLDWMHTHPCKSHEFEFVADDDHTIKAARYTPHSKLQEAEERIKLLHKNLNSCHEHIARQDRELIALRNKLDGGKTADDILKGLGSTTNE